MARVYGEPVDVQTSEDGRPARFVWRRKVYTVLGIQEYWVVNRDWWREADPVPEQPELQFWRVEAVTGGARAGRAGRAALASPPGGSYELRRDVADDVWTLRLVAD
jgi:hypothetical protein